MTIALPLPFTPSTPPSLGPVATCARDGADPAAPACAPTPAPRGILPDTIVRIEGHTGRFRVLRCIGTAVSTVGLDGQGYLDAKVGKVARV